MYRLTKPTGYTAPVTIENTDTKASIIIGSINQTRLAILTDEGKTSAPDLKAQWDLLLTDTIAKKLINTAMKITAKPVKTKAKTNDNGKQPVNALDIFLQFAE